MSKQIINVINQVRNETPQEPGEKIAAWLDRTWRVAVAEVEASKEELPRVEARRRYSETKLKRMHAVGMLNENEQAQE